MAMSENVEDSDLEIALSCESSSYDEDGSSSDTDDGSIQDSEPLGLQPYQFEPPADENDQEAGGDRDSDDEDDNFRHRLNNSDW